MCQIQQKFPLGQGHRKNEDQFLLVCLTVYPSIWGRWKGCSEGLATDKGVCASVSPQCSGNGVLGWLLTVLWCQSVHRLGTSPESRSGPGDWWLFSVSNYSISKYLNRTIVWGNLRVCFLPAPGWPSSDLPTATLKLTQCWKVGCFQQWPSGKQIHPPLAKI